MKKYLMTVVAAIVAAGFTSCSNEVDMFEPINSDKATINLNITNDNLMITRTESNVTNASSWYIKVGTNDQISVSELSSKKYTAGEYTIVVSNYATEAAAILANQAYYSGSLTKNLVKGSNDVIVSCGKAKNCRVKADLAGLADFSAITAAKLTVSQEGVDNRILNTTNTTGYFYAGTGKTISYALDYKYDGIDATTLSGTISNPVAATEYQVKVVTNTNGTITLTITYDTEFTENTVETITIDAATGKRA